MAKFAQSPRVLVFIGTSGTAAALAEATIAILRAAGPAKKAPRRPATRTPVARSHRLCAIQDIDFEEISARFGRAVQGLAPGHAGVHVVHAKR